MRFIATCKLGLESTVSAQLKRMGIVPEQTEDARIYFNGDFAIMAECLLRLRTAERLLLEVGSFNAETFTELFDGVYSLNWKKYLPKNASIHVTGKSAKSTLFSVSDCQSITKKAIVEKLKASYGVSVIPETGKEVIVEVGLFKNKATLCLDCCGAGLSRRGYRTYNVPAPISETLAAGILDLSHYRSDRPLIDPMCGSGTIPIEAAMIAADIAPGLNRSFSAESWEQVPSSVFALARENAKDRIVRSKVQISGYDIDERSVALCKIHAKKAGVSLKWDIRDVRELTSDAERGIIVCNPPYGERLMSENEVRKLYAQMKDRFDLLPGWTVNIISGMRGFEAAYGQTADKRRKLSNGGMSCTLYQYYKNR